MFKVIGTASKASGDRLVTSMLCGDVLAKVDSCKNVGECPEKVGVVGDAAVDMVLVDDREGERVRLLNMVLRFRRGPEREKLFLGDLPVLC